MQKLVQCCNWLLTGTRCKIISAQHVREPKLFRNLCLSFVSGVPHFFFRATPLVHWSRARQRHDSVVCSKRTCWRDAIASSAMGVRTQGQVGSADPPGKMGEKLNSEKHAKKSSFLNISRAIGAGRCRERRYADHIFIQIYFRMHHFVVEFSKFSSPQTARGH